MKRKIFLILIISVFSLNVFGQKDWQKRLEKIKLLKTTEAEVEKMFGKAGDRYGDVGDYEIEDGILTVIYSEGKCESKRKPAYNVDKGVVVRLQFDPGKKIKFESLGINSSELKKLKTVASRDTDAIFITYYDAAKGIYYTLDKDLLDWVEVYPLDEFDYLQCSESSV